MLKYFIGSLFNFLMENKFVNYKVTYKGKLIQLKNLDTDEIIDTYREKYDIDDIEICDVRTKIFSTEPEINYYRIINNKIISLNIDFPHDYINDQYICTNNQVKCLLTNKTVIIKDFLWINNKYVIFDRDDGLYYAINNYFNDKLIHVTKMDIQKFSSKKCVSYLYKNYFISHDHKVLFIHDLTTNKTIYIKNITKDLTFSHSKYMYIHEGDIHKRLKINANKVVEEKTTYWEDKDILMFDDEYVEHINNLLINHPTCIRNIIINYLY